MSIKRKKLLKVIRKEIRQLKHQKYAKERYDYQIFNLFYTKVKRLEIPYSFTSIWGIYDGMYDFYEYNDKLISEQETDISVSSVSIEQFSLLILMENISFKVEQFFKET